MGTGGHQALTLSSSACPSPACPPVYTPVAQGSLALSLPGSIPEEVAPPQLSWLSLTPVSSTFSLPTPAFLEPDPRPCPQHPRPCPQQPAGPVPPPDPLSHPPTSCPPFGNKEDPSNGRAREPQGAGVTVTWGWVCPAAVGSPGGGCLGSHLGAGSSVASVLPTLHRWVLGVPREAGTHVAGKGPWEDCTNLQWVGGWH